MLIAGMNKTTLLDYPGRVAATVFVGGCNFRCPFCHNAGLVLEPLSGQVHADEEIFSFLKKRKGIIKGVCITGGEPTLHADLPEFAAKIKKLGLLVKLDTNGYEPRMLERLLKEKLLDYVAMDIKNCPAKYAVTAGMGEGIEDGPKQGLGNFHMERIERSVELLKESGIDYEFRTTVVKELHRTEDLLEIAAWIKGCPHYYLQQFKDSENMICFAAHGMKNPLEKENMSGSGCFHGYEKDEMERMAEGIRAVPGMTGEVLVRGAD